MSTTQKPKPLHDALAKVRISDVAIAGTGLSSRDTVDYLLQQAHSLTLVLEAAFRDAGDLEARSDADSSLHATRNDLKADAISGVGTLIGLAAALAMEG